MIKKTIKKNLRNAGGFTLIELLVAMAVFGFCVTALTGIFISFTNAQKKVSAIQSSQEVGRYLVDYMTKEIRMSFILSNNSFSSSGTSSLHIKNADGKDVVYSFSGGVLTRVENGISSQLTPPVGVIATGRFYIASGLNLSGGKVTIVMEIKKTGNKEAEESEVDMQSTIAARSE